MVGINRNDERNTDSGNIYGGFKVFEWDKFALKDEPIYKSAFSEEMLNEEFSRIVDDGCFVILDEIKVNAFAYMADGKKVAAITSGALYQCMYMANLFMLKDNFFPDIGEETACYSEVSPDIFPAELDSEGNIVLPESGDDERRNIGRMITVLALKFMIYHEFGHHALGHLYKYGEVFGLGFGETSTEKHRHLTPDESQVIETAADIYSVEHLLDVADTLLSGWNSLFEVPLGHLEYVCLLAAALVIVKECLASDVYSVEPFDQHKYLPKIIRLTMTLAYTAMTADTMLIDQFKEMLSIDFDTRKAIEEQNGPTDLDNPKWIRDALISYLSSVTLMSEYVFRDVFLGTKSPMAFRDDITASERWMRRNS